MSATPPTVMNEVARFVSEDGWTIVTCEAPRARTILLWGRPVRLNFPYVIGVAGVTKSGAGLTDPRRGMLVLGSLKPIAPGAAPSFRAEHPVFVMPLPHVRSAVGSICLMSPTLVNGSSPIDNVWQSDFRYVENTVEMKRWIRATPEETMSAAWWSALSSGSRSPTTYRLCVVFPLSQALAL